MSWTTPEDHPDPILARRFGARLRGRWGRPLYALGSTPSTQTVLHRLAADGAPEGTVVVADHQTRGRGRYGRSWVASPGRALLASILLRPALPPPRLGEIGLAAAVAAADALETTAGVAVRIKWPNDLLVGSKKVAGILAEAALEGAGGGYVALGVGINVSQGPEEFPSELRGRATSLALAGGRPVGREALLAALLAELEVRYRTLSTEGFPPIREAWLARAVLGQRVVYGGGEGVAVDLAPDGGLIVRNGDGRLTTIVSGEVG